MVSNRPANVDALFNTLRATNPAAFNILTNSQSTVGLGSRIFGNPLIGQTGNGIGINAADFNKVLADIDGRLSGLLEFGSGNDITRSVAPSTLLLGTGVSAPAGAAGKPNQDLINQLKAKGINIGGTPSEVAKALQEKPSDILSALGLTNFGIRASAAPANAEADKGPDISALLASPFGGSLLPQTAFSGTTFGIGTSLLNPFLTPAGEGSEQNVFNPVNIFDIVSSVRSRLTA